MFQNFGDRKIQVSNAPGFDGVEESEISNALCVAYDKLQRIINNELLLSLNFKSHDVGKKIEHEVHLKLSFPGKTVIASESGWVVVGLVHKALHVLERETIEAVKGRR